MHVYHRVKILCRLMVGQPFAVGRPGIVGDFSVRGMIYLMRLLVLDAHPPQVQIFVGPGELLAVRRPGGRELESSITTRDLLFFAESILMVNVDFIFSAAIG